MPSPVSVRVSRVRIRVRLSFRLCDATDMKVKLCICACVRYNVVDFRRLHLDVDKRLILVGRRRTVPALPLTYMLQWRRAVMTPAVETRHHDDAVVETRHNAVETRHHDDTEETRHNDACSGNAAQR